MVEKPAAKKPAAVEKPTAVKKPAVVKKSAAVKKPAAVERPVVVEKSAAVRKAAKESTADKVKKPAKIKKDAEESAADKIKRAAEESAADKIEKTTKKATERSDAAKRSAACRFRKARTTVGSFLTGCLVRKGQGAALPWHRSPAVRKPPFATTVSDEVGPFVLKLPARNKSVKRKTSPKKRAATKPNGDTKKSHKKRSTAAKRSAAVKKRKAKTVRSFLTGCLVCKRQGAALPLHRSPAVRKPPFVTMYSEEVGPFARTLPAR